jgi:hypothetical protein
MKFNSLLEKGDIVVLELEVTQDQSKYSPDTVHVKYPGIRGSLVQHCLYTDSIVDVKRKPREVTVGDIYESLGSGYQYTIIAIDDSQCFYRCAHSNARDISRGACNMSLFHEKSQYRKVN